MKNSKFNIDRDKVSSEEIKSRKDFDSIVNQYHTSVKVAKPIYKTTFFKGVAVVSSITIITTVMVWSYQARNKKNSSLSQTQKEQVSSSRTASSLKKQTKRSIVSPPIAGVNVKRDKFLVSASKGGSVKYKTGTQIKVPENAFVDKKGKAVKGNVEIKYREFHDLADIIASGIPMTYNKEGKLYHFESAGMMEIQAYKDEEQVFLRPGKNVNVEMASANGGNEFSLYYLDTIVGNWVHKGKDKVGARADMTRVYGEGQGAGNSLTRKMMMLDKKIEETQTLITQRVEAIPAVVQPIKPMKASSSKFHFDIEFDKAEFPELANFNGLLFEVDENQKDFSSSTFDIEWEDIELENVDMNKNKYKVKVKKGKNIRKFEAYPVFEGKNYDHAVAEYQKRFQAYKQKLEARKDAEKKVKEEMDAKIAQYKKEKETMIAAENKIQLKDLVIGGPELSYLRVFSISGFGIYNCDNPLNFPKGRNIMARLMDENGRDLNLNSSVFLIEKGKNAIYTYSQKNAVIPAFQYNPTRENILYGFTQDGELLSFMPDDFKTIPSNANEFKLKMKKINKKLETVEDVRTYFGLIKGEINSI